MKTPDEIKRRLASAIPFHLHPGDPEPRLTPRKLLELEERMADALSYIQQLEAERDAAVRTLRDAWTCDGCIHEREPLISDSCITCCRCSPNDPEGKSDHWKWRGVHEHTKED